MEELILIQISFSMPDKNREELARKVSVLTQRAMDIAGEDSVKVTMVAYIPNEPEPEPQPELKPERDTYKDGF